MKKRAYLLILIVIISCLFFILEPSMWDELTKERYSPILKDAPLPEIIVSRVDGEDYSLPNWVESEEFSGYVCGACDNAVSGNMWIGWGDLEPQKGVYDWVILENRLTSLAAQGKTGSLHLLSITVGGSNNGITVSNQVPEWVYEEYGLDPENLPIVGDLFDIIVIPQWREEIRNDFNNLVIALGEEYNNDPRLESVYVHGISNSRGEELWMMQPYLDDIESDWGLTPEVMYDWLSSRIDAYAEAFEGNEYRLAWVGERPAWFQERPDFEQVSRDLIDYAWSKGLGNRHGGVETYTWRLDMDSFANEVVDGYVIVDEGSHIFDGRYFGDENEAYGSTWEWYFGSYHSDPYRYKMAIMRALQSRVRWLWSYPPAEEINPPLSKYARLSFGKTVDNSPDAWARLFEAVINPQYYGGTNIKNFERWLMQRDVEGGMTVPALYYYKGFDSGAGSFYDYTARRTDLISGNNTIYFDLDDNFVVRRECEIKVEILDQEATTWNLIYSYGAEEVSSEDITTDGSGGVETYTLDINGCEFNNGLDFDMDFKLVVTGSKDLVVNLVRVVRDSICGDSTCDAEESCSSCALDCGVCNTNGGNGGNGGNDDDIDDEVITYCGDGFCDSNESCEDCVSDCGICLFEEGWELSGSEIDISGNAVEVVTSGGDYNLIINDISETLSIYDVNAESVTLSVNGVEYIIESGVSKEINVGGYGVFVSYLETNDGIVKLSFKNQWVRSTGSFNVYSIVYLIIYALIIFVIFFFMIRRERKKSKKSSLIG